MKKKKESRFIKALKNNYKMIAYMSRYGKSQIAISAICDLSATIITIIDLISIRYICNIITQKDSAAFLKMVLGNMLRKCGCLQNYLIYLEEKLAESTNAITDIISKFGKKFVGLYTINNVWSTITNCVIIIHVAVRVMNGEMLIGDFLTVISGSTQFAAKLGNLLNIFPQMYEHSLYIDNFFEFMNVNETERKSGLPLSQINEIKMENVGFSYSNADKETVSNINIDIKKGQRIALVGKKYNNEVTYMSLSSK